MIAITIYAATAILGGQPNPAALQGLVEQAMAWNFGTKGSAPSGQSESGYRVGVDTSEKFGDSPSLTIASLPGSKSGWRAACQTIRADRYRGKRVRFRAQVKCDQVQGSSGIWLRVDLPRGDLLTSGPERSVSGTHSWQPETAVLDVPKNAVDISFGPLLIGSGQVWVSDLAMDTVGKDVPVSYVPVDPQLKHPNRRPTNLALEPSGSGSVTFPGWTADTSKNAGVRSAEGTMGKKGVLLESAHNSVGLYQFVDARRYLGKRLRFRSFVKSAGAAGHANVHFAVMGRSLGVLAADEKPAEVPSRAQHETEGWREIDEVLDVPSEAHVIVFGYELAGAGRMWVSGPSLSPVPLTTKSTELISTSPNRYRERIASLPFAPANLAFDK